MAENWNTIGRCALCSNGTDETENLTEADAPARTTDKTPLPLVFYQDRWLCARCKGIEIRREESRRIAAKAEQNQRFLGESGVNRTV